MSTTINNASLPLNKERQSINSLDKLINRIHVPKIFHAATEFANCDSLAPNQIASPSKETENQGTHIVGCCSNGERQTDGLFGWMDPEQINHCGIGG